MLRFAPYYQPAIWGGNRLKSRFGREVPAEAGPIGESWELVDLDFLPQRASLVSQGPQAGQPLGELWRQGVLGGSAQGQFPFLLKWLDAAQALSVQVHPDGAACKQLGFGQPKSEAWYVVEAAPKAALLIGHYPGLDPKALQLAATSGTLAKWLYSCQPRPGDLFYIEAGTIHAIGGGFLLLEVQQPSDTTFRIYDWGRVGSDGLARPLHLDEAAASIHYTKSGPPKVFRQGVDGPSFAMRCLPPGTQIAAEPLRVFAADTGVVLQCANGTQETLRPGDVVVAEKSDGTVTVQEHGVLFLTEAPT